MRVRLALIAGMLVLFAGNPAAARAEGRGFFTIGLQNANLSRINGPMVSRGYSRFGENFGLIGGGGYAVMGRFMIGGEGYGLMDRDSTRGTAQARLGAGYGLFDLGYIFWTRNDLSAYGMLGIGGGGWSLRITDSAAVPLDEVLADPGRSSAISNSQFLLSLSAGADWFFRIGGSERGGGGMSLGLRAGYTLAPFQGAWEMEDFEITSGEKMGLAGPFVQLIVGFGGRGTR